MRTFRTYFVFSKARILFWSWEGIGVFSFAHVNFQSFYENKWPLQNFCQIHYVKIQGLERWGSSTLWWLWLLKKTIELLITNPASPFWSSYDHSFYIHSICPQGITDFALWAVCVFILKDIISVLLMTWNKIAISKFRLDRFGKMVGERGG